MIEDRDQQTAYCRRLGHAVPFKYCRTETFGSPCRLALDCWWEQFDVRAFLEENLAPDQFNALCHPASPPVKMVSLFDLIREAKSRIEEPTGGETCGETVREDSH